jgi:hypothetical protein
MNNSANTSCLGETLPLLEQVPIWQSAPRLTDSKLNINEFIFKLNLPSIDERFKEEWKHLLEFTTEESKNLTQFRAYKVEQVFKTDWINWYGMEWVWLFRFFKNNYTGRIHDDGGIDAWGINWVMNGYATIKYWKIEQMEKIYPVIEHHGNPIQVFETTAPPVMEYILPPGVYLVKTGDPHLPAGFNNRVLLSLRAKDMPWAQVIDHFSEFII